MRTQTAVGARLLVPSGRAAPAAPPRRCRAELSNDLLDEEGMVIERLIDLAFATLGVQALDVRVTTGVRSHMLITVQDVRSLDSVR